MIVKHFATLYSENKIGIPDAIYQRNIISLVFWLYTRKLHGRPFIVCKDVKINLH